MPKLSKDKCIELICEELKKGSTYKITFGVIQSKTKLVESTFASYWKIANVKHREAQDVIEKEKAEQYKQSELDRQNGLILDRNKILLFSSNVVKIAYNNVIQKKDDKSIYSFFLARDGYSKMQGFDTPTKKEAESNENDTIIIE